MTDLISLFSQGQLSIPLTRLCMMGAWRSATETKALLKSYHSWSTLFTNHKPIGNEGITHTFKILAKMNWIIICIIPESFLPLKLTDIVNHFVVTEVRSYDSRISDILRTASGNQVDKRSRVLGDSCWTVDELFEIWVSKQRLKLLTISIVTCWWHETTIEITEKEQLFTLRTSSAQHIIELNHEVLVIIFRRKIGSLKGTYEKSMRFLQGIIKP